MAAGDAKSSMTDEERLGTSWKVLLRIPKARPIRIQSGFVAASFTKKDNCGIARRKADWWFGTCFILPYIGIFITPIDFYIFQNDRNHQPEGD